MALKSKIIISNLLFIIFIFIGCHEMGGPGINTNIGKIENSIIWNESLFPTKESELYCDDIIYHHLSFRDTSLLTFIESPNVSFYIEFKLRDENIIWKLKAQSNYKPDEGASITKRKLDYIVVLKQDSSGFLTNPNLSIERYFRNVDCAQMFAVNGLDTIRIVKSTRFRSMEFVCGHNLN